MTTVYVLLHTVAYEGSSLRGVYASREEAQAAWDAWAHGRGAFATPEECDICEVVVGAPASCEW
jgi:hypothetical protein